MTHEATEPAPERMEAALSRIASREEVLADQDSRLAPYAGRESVSRGRARPESPDPLRTDYQRDRDRIVHSTAFRRLIGKTQVFVSDTGDHYRVRLTHSLEVAQIATAIARSLRLNATLAEVLALAHDLGHAPFGHSGGDILDGLMKDHGGFEHNLQAVRVVDLLELKYPEFEGLNLTYEVRESILKHHRPFEGPAYAPFHPEEGPLLEADIVDQADGIAYNSADLDDGLRSGLLSIGEVRELKIWQEAEANARSRHPDLGDGRMLRHKVVGELIALYVRDLIRSTAARLDAENIRTLADVRAAEEPLVGFSDELKRMDHQLRGFLYERFYTHYKVSRMRHRARVVIEGLFEALMGNPGLMPPRYQELAEREGRERTVADYISGMTDGYAQKEYGLLFQPGSGSLDP